MFGIINICRLRFHGDTPTKRSKEVVIETSVFPIPGEPITRGIKTALSEANRVPGRRTGGSIFISQRGRPPFDPETIPTYRESYRY